MADTSNTFSLNGLNRQKKLSGIYARRPENIDQYFTRTSLNIPPMYVRCLSAKINNAGNDQYSYGCYPVFPDPQHPSGIRASGSLLLEPTSNSFSLSNNGTNYNLGDSFTVYNEKNEAQGNIVVDSTGVNGSISTFYYSHLNPPTKVTATHTVVSDDSNTSAVFVSNPNNFKISQLHMTNFGHGYQTFDNTTKQTITHSVSISGAGNGSGHDITCDFTPLVITEANLQQFPAYISDYKSLDDNAFNTDGVYIVLNDTLTQP